MRDPRFRFSDDVRTATRALALRTKHSGTVAPSPTALAEAIARTDDLRETLINGGYGSAFDADDLFPLYESQVGKAKTHTPARSEAAVGAKWLWIVVTIVLAAGIIAVLVASAAG